ncbi:hypothetical protein ACGFNV_42080 [Streptomyces sp. NPDC048751]|uniref:hypothetical protein n=1 Tax=Streptomyces sp. NPDC048751 TaxID=3365591 RepID=UPI0037166560
MDEEQGVGVREDTVTLEYELQRADMTDAVRLLTRKRGKAGFIHRPAFLVCVALFAVGLIVVGVRNRDAGGMSYGVMFFVWVVLMFFAPRISAGQLLKANQHHGTVRVTVGAAGVRTVSAHADMRMGWANYGSYTESDRVIALRSPDRAGRCAIVLAKRGARSPEDSDRLRALLDRHLPRV